MCANFVPKWWLSALAIADISELIGALPLRYSILKTEVYASVAWAKRVSVTNGISLIVGVRCLNISGAGSGPNSMKPGG